MSEAPPDPSAPGPTDATPTAPAPDPTSTAGTLQAAEAERADLRDDSRVPLPPASTWFSRAGWHIATAVTVLYVLARTGYGFVTAVPAWAYDPDQRQAVWHYWRYTESGLFPAGDLLTDYAFVMHAPPLWWVMMASLSALSTPLLAAKLLNLFAYWATFAVGGAVVARLTNRWMGLLAVVVLVRNPHFHNIVAGGYARSFGPLLVLLFLWAFLQRRHRLVLGILVAQAALYPSVVLPCGFAYGLYCLFAGPTWRTRLMRWATLGAAGALIIVLGLIQDVRAPSWWGGMVSLKEASTMVAWKRGGRVSEVPLKPVRHEVWKHVRVAFNPNGHVPVPEFGAWHRDAYMPVFALSFIVAIAALWAGRRRYGRAAALEVGRFPWEFPLLFGSAFVTYLVARQFAFKLYLPYRSLAHVWPYVLCLSTPIVAWLAAARLWRGAGRSGMRRAVVTTGVVVLSLLFGISGDNLETPTSAYRSVDHRLPLYAAVQTLPKDAVLAGQLALVDEVPLLGKRRVLVNKVLAHPFRLGLWAELERRLKVTSEALYAADPVVIFDYAQREGVTHLIVGRGFLRSVDRGLFAPILKPAQRAFRRGQEAGFALARVPASAVVFMDRHGILIDVAQWRVAHAAGTPADARVAPTLGTDAPEAGGNDDGDGDDER